MNKLHDTSGCYNVALGFQGPDGYNILQMTCKSAQDGEKNGKTWPPYPPPLLCQIKNWVVTGCQQQPC